MVQPPATATEPSGWLEVFVPFSLVHVAMVAAAAAAMFGSCALGRRGGEPERRFRLRWGWFIALFALVSNAWWLWPSNFRLDESLPLHICDLAVIVAAIAMLSQARWSRTLLYFWGIGLSTQAFFTPTLEAGAAAVRFWIFWVGHTAIVGSAVYDVVVGGYRPAARDFAFAVSVSVAYTLSMVGLDAAMNVNYGYVGPHDPAQRTIIQSLGPWPWRIVALAGIVLVDYLFLWGIGARIPPLAPAERRERAGRVRLPEGPVPPE